MLELITPSQLKAHINQVNVTSDTRISFDIILADGSSIIQTKSYQPTELRHLRYLGYLRYLGCLKQLRYLGYLRYLKHLRHLG